MGKIGSSVGVNQTTGEVPACPKCGSVNIRPWGKQLPRIYCVDCQKTSTVRANHEQVVHIDNSATVIEFVTSQVFNTNVAYTAVGLFDAHLEPGKVHPSYLIAKQFTLDMKPDYLVIGGDFSEVASLSSWEKPGHFNLEGRRYAQDVRQVLDELIGFKEKLPDTKIVYLGGNHEDRVRGYVEKAPQLVGQLDWARDLDLKALNIGWRPYNDYEQNCHKIGELLYLHGTFWNKYFARSTLEAIGDNCVFGHAHKSQHWTQRLKAKQLPHGAWGIGCLTNTNPDWKRGKPTDFVNSFAYVEYQDSGVFNLHELFIIDNAMSFGGRTWRV